jgi:hypothetical protein
MAVIEGMVDRRSLLELDTGGRRKEEVFLILRAQSLVKTSNRSPLVECTGFAESWGMVVCVQLLGSSCSAGRFLALGAGFLRASEVVMLKMIQRVSRDLQDVS